MTIEYLVEGVKYSLSYSELKDEYTRHCEMSDEVFMANIQSAAHTACMICYLKEIPTYVCLYDEGIIRQLIHLMHIPKDTLPDLKEIRKLFKQQLKL